MSQQARRTLNIGIIVAMALAFAIAVFSLIGPASTSPAQAQTAVSDRALALIPAVRLIQLGFDERSLAAAGANASTVDAALSHLASRPADLETLARLDAAEAAATQKSLAAHEALRAGGASPDRVSAYETAEAELTARRAKRQALSEALRTDVSDVLAGHVGADGAAVRERFHANRDRLVPDEFKALDLTEAHWRTLERACLKQSSGQTLKTDKAALLAQCENHPQAALVASRLSAGAPAIANALRNAIDAAR